MKILIVENDPRSSLELHGILTKNGFEVSRVDSIKKAINKLQTDMSVELIISDVDMPESSGFDLLNYINKNKAHYKIPVLMCSETVDKNIVLNSKKLGASDFIKKPVDPDKLMEKIGKILQPKSTPRVMVVDDDEFILEILEKIIRREGFEVTAISSAREALEKLESEKIEAVISDIVMPEMDGIELLKQVKSKYPEIRVLMITGHTGRYGSESVMDIGADGFISKPFKNIEITRTLRRLIDNI